MWFGGFIVLAALVPSLIVASQLLFTGKSSTDAGSLIPGAAMILWGMLMMTDRNRVTVHAEEQTLRWRRSFFGIVIREVTLTRREIAAVERIYIQGLKSSTYQYTIRTTQGRHRTLCVSSHYMPEEVSRAVYALDIPVEDNRSQTR